MQSASNLTHKATSSEFNRLVGFLVRFNLLGLLLEVQENEREDEQAEHHGEGAGVVGISAGDEPLVLRVREWPDGHLGGAVEMRHADPVVVDLELVNAVHVGNLELRLILPAADGLQSDPDERVDAHKLQLHVVRHERLPLAVDELLNLDGVHHRLEDCVTGRRFLLALLEVLHRCDADLPAFPKHPLADGVDDVYVAGLIVHGVVADLLDLRQDCIVGEEEKRAGEHHAGVVARLQCGDEDCALADGVWVLLDGRIGDVAVGGGVGGEERQDERVFAVGEDSCPAVQQGLDVLATNDDLGADEVLGRGDDGRVVAGVEQLVVVQVINHRRVLLVDFKAALRCELADGFA